MKIYFDTEFIEDGKTIDLISIGMVREDGAELYLQNIDCDRNRASQWVKDNVFPHLGPDWSTRTGIANEIVGFSGKGPEFWGYYADYDWVVFCQLFGRMVDLPSGWPMRCLDLRQWLDHRGLEHVKQPDTDQHHALSDARWIAETYRNHCDARQEKS